MTYLTQHQKHCRRVILEAGQRTRNYSQTKLYAPLRRASWNIETAQVAQSGRMCLRQKYTDLGRFRQVSKLLTDRCEVRLDFWVGDWTGNSD